jgi:hypothetical protein
MLRANLCIESGELWWFDILRYYDSHRIYRIVIVAYSLWLSGLSRSS